MLILFDDSREKEADFYIPADKISLRIVTQMIKKGGGLICVAVTQKQAQKSPVKPVTWPRIRGCLSESAECFGDTKKPQIRSHCSVPLISECGSTNESDENAAKSEVLNVIKCSTPYA